MQNLKCVIEKIDRRKINPESSSIKKIGEHIPSSFSMSKTSSSKSIENKHDVYRGKDSMKKFYKSFREHTMEISNFKNSH